MLQSLSVRSTAIMITTVTATLVAFLGILVGDGDMTFTRIGIVSLATWILSYFLIRTIISRLIFQKINPIYKTIENIPITKDELKKKLEGKDVIQEVNRIMEQ